MSALSLFCVYLAWWSWPCLVDREGASFESAMTAFSVGLHTRSVIVAYMRGGGLWKKGCARRAGVLALGLNGAIDLGGGDGLDVHARLRWPEDRGLRAVGVVRTDGGRRALR